MNRQLQVSPHGSFRIVLVEDDPSISRLVSFLLTGPGIEVRTCDNGCEALGALESGEWDLLLLDRRLPDMQGDEICRLVKSSRQFDGRQVIMLTANSSMSDKVEGFAVGADDYITKPFEPVELLARVNAARRVIELQKQLMGLTAKLEALSVTDSLTGLYNRRHLELATERAFDQARRYERPFSLALIDVDHFKRINDAFGHQTGDQVLVEVARCFQRSIRSTDCAARYGGDEFIILLPETKFDEVIGFGEKLREAVGALSLTSGSGEIHPTISVGAASFPHTAFGSAAEMMVAADLALYRAKDKGRNRMESERRRFSRPVASQGTRTEARA